VLDALLDPKRPELAFFAAWAMQARKGKAARAVVRRSLELTEALPEPLRRAQVRAIFNVLSQAMLAWLKEASVSTETFPESPWVRAWRLELEATGRSKGIAEGKAEGIAVGIAAGKAEGVLMVLRTRGLAVTDAQAAVVRACKDLAQLDGWLCGAVTTTSAEALLGPQG
jgi:predicted transposase YdaD